MTTMSNCDSS